MLLVKFHVECCQNHVWGPPGARVMSIFIKTYIFAKVREGKGSNGREGRREGREGKGREGQGREGKGREGREGKGTLMRTNTH